MREWSKNSHCRQGKVVCTKFIPSRKVINTVLVQLLGVIASWGTENYVLFPHTPLKSFGWQIQRSEE